MGIVSKYQTSTLSGLISLMVLLKLIWWWCISNPKKSASFIWWLWTKCNINHSLDKSCSIRLPTINGSDAESTRAHATSTNTVKPKTHTAVASMLSLMGPTRQTNPSRTLLLLASGHPHASMPSILDFSIGAAMVASMLESSLCCSGIDGRHRCG